MILISEVTVFLISMFITGCNFIALIYAILLLTEIECCDIDPKDCCKKLNRLTLVKVVTNSSLSMLHFLATHYCIMLITLPMTVWLVYELYAIPSYYKGVYDPYEVTKTKKLHGYMRNCKIRLGYVAVFFFYSLYRCFLGHINGKIDLPLEDITDHDFEF